MQHAELTLNVVAEEQQILQPVVVVAQQNLQHVPTTDMPSTVRDIEASSTSLPIVHSDKQPANLKEVPHADNSAVPLDVASSDIVPDFVPSHQVHIPDIKGKADVPIPHIGSSSEANPKGNYGSFSLPGSPSLLEIHTLALDHALQVIDGSHLIFEEGLDLSNF